VVRQVKLELADPRRTYTKAFERYALELSRSMTILDVTRHLGVSWDIIKDVQKRDLSRCYFKPKLKDLRQIAIDEIAVAKGHRYLAGHRELLSRRGVIEVKKEQTRLSTWSIDGQDLPALANENSRAMRS
jgi:Helix-turn-helix domain of transposase family ISL3